MAAFAAALSLLAAGASAVPVAPFANAFGPDGLRALSDAGYVTAQGRGAEQRLAAVHWKALDALAAAAPSCRAFSALFASAGDGVPAGPDAGLTACRALPADGVMTPRLQAAAAALDAARQEAWALASSSAGVRGAAGQPNLFETPWGRDLAARRRADRLEDHAALAKPFFEELLAGPRPNPDAVKHFLAAAAARGAAGAEKLLEGDAAKGAASDELKALLRRYLQDERRRRGLALAQARLRALAADKKTLADLKALDALTAPLADKPGLLGRLEAAVSAAPASAAAPKLLSAGAHLSEPTRLGQHELGDEATFSGAYWVDGLPEGASVELEETTLVETPAALTAVETHAVKRRNGGPYPYSRTVTIDQTRPFAGIAVVSAASGSMIAERVEVPVAGDFELALKKEAAALQDEQSCDPKSAEAAFRALAELTADAAKVKPQYKDLCARAEKGAARAVEQAAALAKLEEAVGDARAASSPQQCRYDAARADAAIKLARRLPPGCDRVLPELFPLRTLISRRAADQRWFLKASGEARSLRRSCDFAGASARWAEALAVLEADPAARCGAVDAEAKAAEAELPAARAASAWSETLAAALDKAETATVPAARLELLRPAVARLSALDDRSCRRDLLRRAEKLAAAAGEAETGPSEADAARRLPNDGTRAALLADVVRARARALGLSDAASAPAAAPKAPETKAAPTQKTPAKRAAKSKKKPAPQPAPKAEDAQ